MSSNSSSKTNSPLAAIQKSQTACVAAKSVFANFAAATRVAVLVAAMATLLKEETMLVVAQEVRSKVVGKSCGIAIAAPATTAAGWVTLLPSA